MNAVQATVLIRTQAHIHNASPFPSTAFPPAPAANQLYVHNEQRARVAITDELEADFQRFWRRHAATPLYGTQNSSNVSSMDPY